MRVIVVVNDEVATDDVYQLPFMGTMSADVFERLYVGAGHHVERQTSNDLITLDVITKGNDQ